MVQRMDTADDAADDVRHEIARATQRALVEVAQRAYEEAGLSGLCEEGRWEVALGAMRSYDVTKVGRLTGL